MVPDRHALVGHAAELGPGGQRGHQPAVDVRGIGAGMPTHLLEPDRRDRPAQLVELGQPVGEAQVAHAAAVVAARAERHGAAGDQAVVRAQRPAGGGAEVEGEHGGRCRQGGGQGGPCVAAGQSQSCVSHDGLLARLSVVEGDGGLVLGGAGRRRLIIDPKWAGRSRRPGRSSAEPRHVWVGRQPFRWHPIRSMGGRAPIIIFLLQCIDFPSKTMSEHE